MLPAIEKQFPGAVQNIYGSIQVFKDVSELYHEAVEKRLRKLVLKEKEIQRVPVRKLEKMEQAGTVLFEWLRHYDFSEGNIGEILRLLMATNGSYVASATHRIIRNRAWLVLAPLASKSAPLQIAESLPYDMIMPDGKKLSIQSAQSFSPGESFPKLPAHEAMLDAAAVELPLIIRPWKQGDYFYPLGMAKKKKVARFLIDQKVSPVDKENVWVVESKKRICWIIGYRIDDRFKIVQQTKNTIRLLVK